MSDALAQDPAELFDVMRADGVPLGYAKPRAAVHRDGDWHQSVHVWVVGRDDETPYLLAQRRSMAKDTWPGRLDATVGGHLRAGEGIDEALRETEEEIGLTISRADAFWLGVRLCASEAEPGTRDREIQTVFLLRDDRPLTAFRPHPVELAALVSLPLPPLLDLLAGDRPAIPAEAIAPGETASRPVAITREDFIPTIDRYFYRVAIAADRFLRGERHIAI